MIPILTPEEMHEVDRGASDPVEVLVARAGAATAREALRLLDGTYGRRVVVVAGKGNNGADGRAAAGRLRRRGVAVDVIDAAAEPHRLPVCDLVIDAAYGTGFRGEYRAPDPGGAPVLAIDIPSGVDGLTGEAGEGAVDADDTVTFAALKPGLLLGAGPDHAGRVHLADIGLDTSGASAWLLGRGDAAAALPRRQREWHKWRSAVWVAAGSPGMTGAAELAARSAMRAGAGSVRLGIPDVDAADLPVGEFIGRSLPGEDWDRDVFDDLSRFGGLVIGPGLGRSDATAAAVRRLVRKAPIPVVVDADGLFALGSAADAASLLRDRPGGVAVLTPHDGEFARLAGSRPGADRLGATRQLADALGAVVLLKGSTTVVAEPAGRVFVSAVGTPALATAGTGDVLSGVIGALLADGLDGLTAAGVGAWLHATAARRGPSRGLVASDLLDLLPDVLTEIAGEATPSPAGPDG